MKPKVAFWEYKEIYRNIIFSFPQILLSFEILENFWKLCPVLIKYYIFLPDL